MDASKNETLNERDLQLVYEELIDVSPKWYNFGLGLGLSPAELERIRVKYDDPIDRLREALLRWLKRSLSCNWKTVVDSLKGNTVREERLAKQLEIKYHIDQGKANSDGGGKVALVIDGDVTDKNSRPDQFPASKRVCTWGPSSMPGNDQTESGLDELAKECFVRIKKLETKFEEVVTKSQKTVNDTHVTVHEVCSKVTLLPLSLKESHSDFIKENISVFASAKSINELFYRFNLYWDYLNYTLLQHIVETYGDEETKGMMQEYIADVTAFRKETSLYVFWKACPPKHMEPPSGLKAILSTHKKFAPHSTLEEVERFRCEFAENYSLPKFVLILREIEKGSVIITWFLPATFDVHEQVKGGGAFLEKHHVDSLRWKMELSFEQKIRSLIEQCS